MKRSLLHLGFLLLAVGLLACEPETTDTAILLTIDADFSVPEEIDRITLESPGLEESMDDPAADLREQALPRSILLRHAGGPYGPLRITASAFKGETRVAQRTLDTAFLPGLQAHLELRLTRNCANVFCADGLTCGAGACVPVSEVRATTSSEDRDAGQTLDASFFVPSDAGSARPLDAGSGPNDSGIAKQDAGTQLDAGLLLDASGPKDAGSPGDARSASDTGTSTDSGVQDAGPGATPVCVIDKPLANATLLTGVSFPLQGSCTDAESGPLTTLVWASNVDGQLATGGATTAVLRTLGAHNILLCAPDPRAPKVVGCATVRVNATAQPTAQILSVRQGTSEQEPFSAGMPITLSGVGTGAGVTLQWRDSLQGALGSGTTIVLGAPLVGRHIITLDARDQYGLTASATRSFLVAPGR